MTAKQGTRYGAPLTEALKMLASSESLLALLGQGANSTVTSADVRIYYTGGFYLLTGYAPASDKTRAGIAEAYRTSPSAALATD
jgi:hypothetical protein